VKGARFQIDEDVPYSCAEAGEALGLDIRSANRDDFLAATHDAFASCSPHAGLLTFRTGSLGT
jgi:hypothetical protein